MKVDKGRKLVEADVEAVADAIGAEDIITPKESKGVIWNELDNSLEAAKERIDIANGRGKRAKGFPNLLFIGGAGIGKTAQINSWAEDRGVNLFTLQGSSLDAADMRGLPMIQQGNGEKKIRAQKVGTGILDQLDRPNSVLFLDELNRAQQDVRAALLQLINEHIVQDFEEDGGMRYFPNFLFTVAAINPSGKAGYQTFELDSAEKGRFGNINLTVENDVIMNYLVSNFEDEAKIFEKNGNEKAYNKSMGKAALSKKLLSAPAFEFDSMESEDEASENDTWNGLTTSPRNLENLLNSTDGTKQSLLSRWSQYCNNLHLPVVKQILANYIDIQNKANDALKGGTDSAFLNRKASGLNKMRSKYGSAE